MLMPALFHRSHQKLLLSTQSQHWEEQSQQQCQGLCSCLGDKVRKRQHKTWMPWTSWKCWSHGHCLSHLGELCSKAHSRYGAERRRMWRKLNKHSWKDAKLIRMPPLGGILVEEPVDWPLRAYMSKDTSIRFSGNLCIGSLNHFVLINLLYFGVISCS